MGPGFLNGTFSQWYADGIISLSGTEIDCTKIAFEGINFPCEVNFSNVTFTGHADFSAATFTSHADFSDATFAGTARFNDVAFTRDTHFENATFSSIARFNDATFTRNTYFDNTTFTGGVFFDDATFTGDVCFDDVKFKNICTFDNSRISQRCSFLNSVFGAVTSFKNTKFKAVPNFNYTSFKQEPHLDHIDIPFIKVNEGEGLVERYRKLKQMAKQSNDFENELKFFGFELHAKSFLETTSRPEAFFIRSYKILSDFGRSLSRPFISLLLFLFTMILINGTYIAFNNTLSEECKTSKLAFSGSVMHYTLSEASPLFKLDKEQSLALEKCLFTKKALDIRNDLWGVTHLVPTSFLLFLFGLAVRNRFRVK